VRKTIQSVKIRKTGNSNAMSLPKGLEDVGYAAGAVVTIVLMPSGELRVLRLEDVARLFREANAADSVSTEDILAALDYARSETDPMSVQPEDPAFPMAGAGDVEPPDVDDVVDSDRSPQSGEDDEDEFHVVN
jgi:antitoxin component of MazEF toxin-antitoxin module